MLSVILNYTEMAIEQIDPDSEVYLDLQEVMSAARRSTEITRQLLAFARKQTVVPQVLDLNATVTDMFKMLRRLIGEDINLTWHPVPDLWPVRIDPSQVDQLLANLCVNARDAISGVGDVIIETDMVTLEPEYCATHATVVPGDYVRLTVSDNGCGMDKEIMEKIFEPFFTTKELGKGTGLGLSTVYGIVEQNNGFVNVYSEVGKGTTFKIYLLRHMGESMVREKHHGGETRRGQGERVLVVEDEPALLELTCRILEKLGYTVLGANNPRGAIKLAGEQVTEIDLLLTDVILPVMNGRDLAAQLLGEYPKLKCLFMSGYTANVITSQGVLEKGIQLIQKPFSTKDLAAKVREALDS
jgi:CheY-like chemotaxis protein